MRLEERKGWSECNTNESDSELSDGRSTLQAVKEVEESAHLRGGKCRPQNLMLAHWHPAKPTISGKKKRWPFKCLYCEQ